MYPDISYAKPLCARIFSEKVGEAEDTAKYFDQLLPVQCHEHWRMDPQVFEELESYVAVVYWYRLPEEL